MLAGEDGLTARIVGGPHPERRFEPAVGFGQIGHRMGPIAESMGVPVVGERIVVGGVESWQVGEQMGHEPMKLGETADAALRQFERVVAHFGFEPVSPLGDAQSQVWLAVGRRHERPKRFDQRVGTSGRNDWLDAAGERGKRRLVLDESLFERHVGRGLVERHGFQSRLARRVPVGTRIDAARQRSLSMSK